MLKGIWVPTVTPFKHDKIDWGTWEYLLEELGKTEINGYVIAGSTGEGIKLLDYELEELIKTAIPVANKFNKKIITGLSPHSLKGAKYQIEKLSHLEIDAFLVLTPFYYGVSENQKELTDFYIELAEFSPRPILVYNMPKYTGFEVLPAVIQSLCQHPNIIGIKYSGNNMDTLMNYHQVSDESFTVISGNGTVFPDFFSKGGESAILAIAHILPEACLDIYKGRRNLNRLEETISFVKESNQLIVSGAGVEGIKHILSKIYQTEIQCRIPFKTSDTSKLNALNDWYEKNKIKL